MRISKKPTRKGSAPQPKRLSTKHKRLEYGLLLQSRAARRREGRPIRDAKGWPW